MSKTQFSACLEWLFAEPSDAFVDRIFRAANAGFDAFEFWLWSNKDIDAICRAVEEYDIAVAGCVAEPLIPLTDPANHANWLAGLEQSIAVAERLGAPVLIAQAGNVVDGADRRSQREALVLALRQAADILSGSRVRLGLEPLNTRADHPGYYLGSTSEAFEIIEKVGRAEVGVVYDLYHSAVMEEPFEKTLSGHVDKIVHVHVADHPGRHEPGSGTVDLVRRLRWLLDSGYDGRIGFEFKPTTTNHWSLASIRSDFARDLAAV
ncbi:TIM barrel protein [Martelella endophytica]|uniref:Hydroxypyruvate isomerase n=1 Tax=Martelella endophytica TaxID=1486262 RepID=A0A0D5LK27_MAREN|nr:TIM barrel protein [Martelella endophytica]AJY44544.1 hydroxypyruvate isomerase [Martelella endophytica]